MKRFRIHLVPVLTCGDRAKTLKTRRRICELRASNVGHFATTAARRGFGFDRRRRTRIRRNLVTGFNFIQDFFSGGRGRTIGKDCGSVRKHVHSYISMCAN